MKFINALAAFSCFFFMAGCVSATAGGESTRQSDVSKRLPTSYAVSGTTTAVVGIGIDKDGIPLETVREIVLLPGQKVIFAGPDRFQIYFKNKKAPTQQLKYESKNGVILVAVPKDIFDQPMFAREYKEKEYLKFDYSIVVNGRELDPPLIVKRDN